MRRTALVAISLVLTALAAGCPQRHYKIDADKQAYDIIDAQWDPSFGEKVNYRISDVSPSPNDLTIDRRVAIPSVLTLPKAVAVATANNREYQNQRELLYTTALNQRLVRHGYETQLFGGGSLLYSHDGDDEAVAAEANVGFNRLLASGALVSTRVGVQWVDVLLGQGTHGFASVFGATVSQPLLRGSDRMVILEPLTQAKRDTLYQIRSFNRFRKTFVVSVITQYYETLEQREIARDGEEFYNSLITLRDRVEKLVNAGRLSSEEWDRLKQEVLRAHDRWILAQKDYERFLDSFKLTLGVPPTDEFDLDEEVYNVLLSEGIPYPDFVVGEAIETGLSRRLDLINQADMVLDAQRKVYVAKDALRTGLDVTGSVDVDSHGHGVVSAGPVVDLPLDRVPEQVEYRNALIVLNQRQRDYDQVADTVRLEIRDAHRKLQETADRYRVLKEGLQLARERIDKNYLLLDYGRVSSRRVLDALQHLHDARNEMADALTDYAIATVNFYRDTDVLQVRPDGMWKVGPTAAPVAQTSLPQKK
ncbi:MAG: TolC family protein [Solirubrobacterales bacterium]